MPAKGFYLSGSQNPILATHDNDLDLLIGSSFFRPKVIFDFSND